MKAKVKICGLRRVQDAEYVNEFKEIEYVGFVFAENSKRYITPKEARIIKEHLRSDIKTVGVFADMSISDINILSEDVGLDIVQLHSEETPEFCKQINSEIWKSIAVSDKHSLDNIDDYHDIVKGFLLDTYSPDLRGGTGKTFNWEIVRNFSQNHFTILAGGLSSDNILTAYDLVKPMVMDLSSSIETNGFKDYNKIKALIGRIRNE